MKNVHGSVHGLGCGGTGFDPVAVVPVLNTVDASKFSAVNVTADDAVVACSLSGLRHGFGKLSVGFAALLQCPPSNGSQRPRFHAQAMTEPSHGPIDLHEELTDHVAKVAQKFTVAHKQIKLITVNHPQTTPVRRGVNSVSLNGYSVNGSVGPSSKTVVVVAGDVDDVRAALGLLHKVSKDVITIFVP